MHFHFFDIFHRKQNELLFPIYSLFPGRPIDLISKTTSFNTKLYFPPLHSLALFSAITLTCSIFRHYTHLLYFPPLHSLAIFSAITLTSHGRFPLTNFLYFHSEFFNFIWFFVTQYVNLIRFTKILYKLESKQCDKYITMHIIIIYGH